ncbi:hypothetical protein ACFS07_13760 [Undibacterium arcticum]
MDNPARFNAISRAEKPMPYRVCGDTLKAHALPPQKEAWTGAE